LFTVEVVRGEKAGLGCDLRERERGEGVNEFPCRSIPESKPGFCTGKDIDLWSITSNSGIFSQKRSGAFVLLFSPFDRRLNSADSQNRTGLTFEILSSGGSEKEIKLGQEKKNRNLRDAYILIMEIGEICIVRFSVWMN
jgi:hypothetical protein